MPETFNGIIGNCVEMRQLFSLISKLADDDQGTVLIHGESGTGKELVAKSIHDRSPRTKKNFVPVNCAAIPDDLLESELFGYAKGAFTGAASNKVGRISYADKGTLFLDEIGDMKGMLQAKLLRVLQERTFEPVGALKPVEVDVRVLAATHRDLEKLVEAGRFREDLYYRLNVIPITIPPLRCRREDIPQLLKYFIKKYTRNGTDGLLGFDIDAMSVLLNLPWRGNVRELENLVQHMSILHRGAEVKLADLPEKYRETVDSNAEPAQAPLSVMQQDSVSSNEMRSLFSVPPEADIEQSDSIDFNVLVGEFEAKLICRALARSNGNKKEAARILKRTTLLEKIKKKNIGDSWKNF